MSKTRKSKELDTVRAEAQLMETFTHPNIVEFKYFKEYANYLVLAIEWCKGGSLVDWMNRRTNDFNQVVERTANSNTNLENQK
mmetsp:Transcript_11464/g.13022  ORF Transcript_11464/g.13022 Transcript_11464/m.13022 type:complete len:83 (-) Transcript_11464:2052-2300(-)